MDDYPIFQRPNLNPPQEQEVPSGVVPPPPQPVNPIAETQEVLQETPPSIGDKFSISRGIILKVVLGILAVFFIIFLVVGLIIPALTRGNSKVTLNYWGLWEDSNIMQSVISDFHRQNPNITVIYAKQDIKQYRERLSTRINNGTGPDIFRFHNTWYPMFSKNLVPLPSDVISKSEFTKIYYPVIQKDLIKNGAIYGIPLSIDTLALYINKDIFQTANLKPPSTWNDFINAAKAITVKDADGKIKTAGASLGTFDNVYHAPDIMSLLFIQNGVNLEDISSTSKNAEDALIFYTSFALGDSGVWDSSLDPSILAFSKGNLGMYFGYSWDFFNIKAINPNLNFEILPVPQLPNQNITLASYWAEGVSVKSKHQKEALLFLKFLKEKENAEKIYTEETKTRAFGEPYARMDLGERLSSNPNVYVFVKGAKNASSSFFVDSTYDNGLNSQMNTYLTNAVNSVLAGVSAQSAVETLSQGVAQVLKQYGQ